MGKVVVVAMTSVDGYYEGRGGAGDLLPMGVDDGFNAYNAEVVEGAAGVVMARRSFEDFASYWPKRESAADASEAEKRFALKYNPLPKTLVTHHPDTVEVPGPWRDDFRVVSEGVEGEVAQLKERARDGDVVIWGSRSLWARLLAAGLVDELHLVAGTGVAVGGTPVFPEDVAVELTPIETRMLADSQCVLTTYAVAAPTEAPAAIEDGA